MAVQTVEAGTDYPFIPPNIYRQLKNIKRREDAPNMVDASVPLTLIRREPFNTNAVQVADLEGKLYSTGQNTHLALAQVDGYDELFAMDGLHRYEAATNLAEKGLEIHGQPLGRILGSLRFGCTIEYVLNEQITASATHGDIKFGRFIDLMLNAWRYTEWADRFPAQSAFALRFASPDDPNPGARLNLRPDETERMFTWVDRASERWGVTPKVAKEWLSIAAVADIELVRSVREREGRGRLKALTPKLLALIVKPLPYRYALQRAIAHYVVERSLNQTETKELVDRAWSFSDDPEKSRQQLEKKPTLTVVPPLMVIQNGSLVAPEQMVSTNGHNFDSPIETPDSTGALEQMIMRARKAETEAAMLRVENDDLVARDKIRDPLLANALSENEDLRKRVAILEERVTGLRAQNAHLTAHNTHLEPLVEQLRKELQGFREGRARMEGGTKHLPPVGTTPIGHVTRQEQNPSFIRPAKIDESEIPTLAAAERLISMPIREFSALWLKLVGTNEIPAHLFPQDEVRTIHYMYCSISGDDYKASDVRFLNAEDLQREIRAVEDRTANDKNPQTLRELFIEADEKHKAKDTN